MLILIMSATILAIASLWLRTTARPQVIKISLSLNLIDISYSFISQLPHHSSTGKQGLEIDESRFFTTCGRYLGEVRLPARAYQGDVFTVALDLQGPEFRRAKVQDRTVKSMLVPLYSSKKLEQVYRLLAKLRSGVTPDEEDFPVEDDGSKSVLEAELLAGGVEIQGPRAQQEPFKPDLKTAELSYLSYRWRCRLPAPGTQDLKLVLSLFSDGDKSRLGEVDHQVKTVRIGRLNKGQVLGLSILLGLGALVLVLAAAWQLMAPML